MIGGLYKDGDKQIYVMLKTSLGFVAACLSDMTLWGTPKKTIRAAAGGLEYTGMKLDLEKSEWIDHDL